MQPILERECRDTRDLRYVDSHLIPHLMPMRPHIQCFESQLELSIFCIKTIYWDS
ncbi:hypothetical protein SCLCIDRAFT_1222002 [Scleroderma citrinum Foug A]|uniref:Uncharacterized protein n=1 Tax=Scleroderma citrinum Foug A TaxID=1036808 RepID=A0A0C2ZP59_9AGAM|nr:hypothetical protein SCLCIDRAFT_1222002 [Scleroderma citrinum Foug A]